MRNNCTLELLSIYIWYGTITYVALCLLLNIEFGCCYKLFLMSVSLVCHCCSAIFVNQSYLLEI